MAKLKQYLENSWYRGASQDRQTGYAAQYQYGYGVNTRDMKNGVCLAGGNTDSEQLYTNEFSFFIYKGYLYYIDTDGDIYDDEGTVVCSTSVAGAYPLAIEFGDYIYVAGYAQVVQVDSTWNTTDVTPTGFNRVSTCVLNYANTFLIIGAGNGVRRIGGGLPGKKIREFESSYTVYGLTQEGNYLKIYASNGVNTKIHYAKGTFDVEDTGLVQTVNFIGLSINEGDVTSDQGNDYVIFAADSLTHQYKLAKISGYNKIDIRWTQKRGTKEVFTSSNPQVKASDGVVFASMEDGIWTFTEYNGWLRGGCCEFPIASNERVRSMFKYGEKLYCCVYDSDEEKYILRYYDMSFHPATYQSSGFIIGRVFDGGCAGLFKKNDQATITYHMPEGTGMELSYRYDRSSFGYDKSNFLPIKEFTDYNSCYDIVVPTTPGIKDANLLALESDDSNTILLENGNNIMLEDLMVCPFNKTWNLLEYRFDFWASSGNAKTPILFEHSLTYYDYMRKYR